MGKIIFGITMIVEIYKTNKEFFEIFEADFNDLSISQFEINDDLWDEYCYLKRRLARINKQIEKIINYEN